MIKNFLFSIVTAEKIIYEKQVSSVVVRCENGKLGILADHAPLLARIVPGEIEINENPGKVTINSNYNGFLEINDNKVTIIFPFIA